MKASVLSKQVVDFFKFCGLLIMSKLYNFVKVMVVCSSGSAKHTLPADISSIFAAGDYEAC